MRIISRKNLVAFYEQHPGFKSHLEAWHSEVKAAQWGSPKEVQNQFPKASTIKDNRVVFRKGNDYRIIVKINYAMKIVYICFLGTHAEYDKIDAETVWNY